MEETQETPLDFARNALDQLNKQKAWAAAKADSIEARITAVGGAVPEELAAALAELRAAAE